MINNQRDRDNRADQSDNHRRRICYEPASIAELTQRQFPPLEWVVDDLLPAGSLSLLSAREKSGKSLLLADLVCAVASDETFLDRAVRQGPTLLIPAEENVREIRDRLLTRLDGNTAAPVFVQEINTSDTNGFDLGVPECIDALRELIARLEPVVVAIDPLREVHNAAENDSDAMAPVMRPLRNLTHRTNVPIVAAHHMSRSGQSRGSTAILGGCDQGWAFRVPEEGPNSSTELAGTMTIKGRFGALQNFGIRLGEGLWWSRTLQAVGSSTAARDRIQAALAGRDDPMTAQQLAEELEVEAKTIQNIMAEDRKKVERIFGSTGTGARNSPYRYFALGLD